MRAHPAGPLHGGLAVPEGIGAPPPDVNAIAAHVWPHGTGRTDGVLTVAGVPVTELAREYQTPLFALAEEDFRSRTRGYQSAFEGMDVYYAGKSFLCGEIVRWLNEDGLGLDVCSGGELALALRAGFPAARIALHGNNKSAAELEAAVRAGVGHVVVDSHDEIGRLKTIAAAAGVIQPVLLRITVGVEAHTHEYIATAHEDQKFGFSLGSGDAREAVRRVITSESLEFRGLHSHIGSQIFDMSGFEVAARRVVELAAAIRDEYGVVSPELDLGGGLGIAYVESDDPPTPTAVAAALRTIVQRECAANNLPLPRVSVEPGRAISGPATISLYEVGTVKPVQIGAGVSRLYVSVDGGMSDNIRTALYDAEYTCVLANRESAMSPVPARVVGKHCESGDIVVRDVWLPGDITPGDLLAVAATGAYCRAMASNYNVVPKPPVVAITAGKSRLLVRRETLEDLFALDTVLCDQPAVERNPSRVR